VNFSAGSWQLESSRTGVTSTDKHKDEVHFAENHSSRHFSQFCYTLQTEGVAPVVPRLASAQAAPKPVRCRNSKVRLLATSSLTACAKRHLGPHWTVQPSRGGRPEP